MTTVAGIIFLQVTAHGDLHHQCPPTHTDRQPRGAIKHALYFLNNGLS